MRKKENPCLEGKVNGIYLNTDNKWFGWEI